MSYMRKINSSNYQTKLKVKAMCPILFSYSLIEGRWKTHVIWAIKEKPLRFSEIRKAIPLATERMVARRLTELLENELIEIQEVDGNKAYAISPRGRMLLPVLNVMFKSGQLIQKSL